MGHAILTTKQGGCTMEQKFKQTLQALIQGTKNYKLTWNYVSDRYYDKLETFYTQTKETDEGNLYITFDSAFEAIYDELLLFITCADVLDEDEDVVGDLYELRIYQNDMALTDIESAVLLYDSLDDAYEGDLKNLFALAAGNASGVDRLMDKLIRELGTL